MYILLEANTCKKCRVANCDLDYCYDPLVVLHLQHCYYYSNMGLIIMPPHSDHDDFDEGDAGDAADREVACLSPVVSP